MRILSALATGLSLLMLPASALAQNFPDHPGIGVQVGENSAGRLVLPEKGHQPQRLRGVGNHRREIEMAIGDVGKDDAVRR